MTSLRTSGVRLREAVVPDWLTEVMPLWLTEAMRSRPAPVPWGAMVRAARAISVPLSVGITVGRRDIGLLPALGGLLGTVVDTMLTARSTAVVHSRRMMRLMPLTQWCVVTVVTVRAVRGPAPGAPAPRQP